MMGLSANSNTKHLPIEEWFTERCAQILHVGKTNEMGTTDARAHNGHRSDVTQISTTQVPNTMFEALIDLVKT